MGADLSNDMTLLVLVRQWWLQAIRENLPDLASEVPFAKSSRQEWLRSADRVVFRLTDTPDMDYGNHGAPFQPGTLDWTLAKDLVDGLASPDAIKSRPDWYGPTVFAYVGPIDQAGQPSTDDIMNAMTQWGNEVALPKVLDANRARVVRAVGNAPSYDVGRLLQAVAIVDDKATRQGTAFHLAGVGYVTCAHVLAEESRLYLPDRPGVGHDLSDIRTNTALDLAVFQIASVDLPPLSPGSADDLALHQHVAVLGFPNYRLGDTGVVVPGLVVGFRPKSGIRRVLTNGYIVAGMSGGPVIDASGQVVGVAVTGADRWEAADDSEDRSFIPIDAVSLV